MIQKPATNNNFESFYYMSQFVKTLVYHQVNDFNLWKKVFDSFYDARITAGELSAEVGTFYDDSKTVYIINEWKSMEAATAFFKSQELVEAMQKAGVINKPQLLFLEKK